MWKRGLYKTKIKVLVKLWFLLEAFGENFLERLSEFLGSRPHINLCVKIFLQGFSFTNLKPLKKKKILVRKTELQFLWEAVFFSQERSFWEWVIPGTNGLYQQAEGMEGNYLCLAPRVWTLSSHEEHGTLSWSICTEGGDFSPQSQKLKLQQAVTQH